MEPNQCELTILMPCLNEAETLEICIVKAVSFLEKNGVDGEVLIADNGSTDGSQEIARRCGARVVDIPLKGYGAALIGGCNEAKGQYVIMGDSDDSYDFTNLMPFLERLRAGDELVMGNRFRGGIEKGAMPPLHRYLGNPVLSTLGRVFFPSEIKDFHCGLRGYNTQSMRALDLQTTGMEYASEMVVKSTLHGLKISEVPTTLKKDGRSRPPHLRSWRDGWRHLKFLLMHCPNWLFLYPGYVLFSIGLILSIILTVGPLTIGGVVFDINTLLYAVMAAIVGVNLILFAVYTRTYAEQTGYIPMTKQTRYLSNFTANKGSLLGIILVVLGIIAIIVAFIIWRNTSFGDLNPEFVMRVTIPSLGLIVIGIQVIFSGFFVDILRIKTKGNGQDEG